MPEFHLLSKSLLIHTLSSIPPTAETVFESLAAVTSFSHPHLYYLHLTPYTYHPRQAAHIFLVSAQGCVFKQIYSHYSSYSTGRQLPVHRPIGRTLTKNTKSYPHHNDISVLREHWPRIPTLFTGTRHCECCLFLAIFLTDPLSVIVSGGNQSSCRHILPQFWALLRHLPQLLMLKSLCLRFHLLSCLTGVAYSLQILRVIKTLSRIFRASIPTVIIGKG